MELFFSRHALQRMFERDITFDEVEKTLHQGTIIQEYNDDRPFPSKLVSSVNNGKPLHVVYALDTTGSDLVVWIVVTVYRPSLDEWNDDFLSRRDIR